VNDRTQISVLTLSIAAVERDTGLSKDTLRVWERRYGFPTPGRDGIGERAYTLDQVEKLRLIKRLMDAGHRPGRIVPLTFAELQALNDALPPSPAQADRGSNDEAAVEPFLALIRKHDAVALRWAMTRALSRLGVTRFITDVVAPLNVGVGDAWLRGQLEVFEEHLYTEALQVVLRQAIAAIPQAPDGARPRVLLSTLPGEPHGLGLLMAEALFALEGGACLSLGVQTPPWDLSKAAAAHRADIVALSFTGCMNPNQVVDSVAELRAKLPPAVQIWAGGAAPVLHRRRVAGVQAMATLGEIAPALMAWRVAHG
jgi:MerR family transcriptional regulator, light-induced transcriptional regulator